MITLAETIKKHNSLTNNQEYINEIEKFKIGNIYTVETFYLFPSLVNNEFEAAADNVESGHISINENPVQAFVSKDFRRLIIEDGHHRFYQALKNNTEYLKVEIVEHCSLCTYATLRQYNKY